MKKNRLPFVKYFLLAYAMLALGAGSTVALWPNLVTTDNGTPPYLFSAIRTTGAAFVIIGCLLVPVWQQNDLMWLRKVLFWLGCGHAFFALIAAIQQKAIWDPSGQILLNALFFIAYCCMFIWRISNPDPELHLRLTKLFDQPKSMEKLRSTYEQEIREAASQQERNRLARDLHDSIKQQIFAIQTGAAAAQARFDNDAEGAKTAIADVRTYAREAMTEMEVMLDQWRSAPLETVGMVEAIRKQAEALGFRTSAKVNVEIGDLPKLKAVPPGVPQGLFRIAQEAMANVARHARASLVTVRLYREQDRFHLQVVDNGAGFDTSAAESGMGMGNIRSRVEELGGTLEVVSLPGEGTQVHVSVPLMPVSEATQGLVWRIVATVGAFLISAIGLFYRPNDMYFWLMTMWFAWFAIDYITEWRQREQ